MKDRREYLRRLNEIASFNQFVRRRDCLGNRSFSVTRPANLGDELLHLRFRHSPMKPSTGWPLTKAMTAGMD